MGNETARYIINYFSGLLTIEERMAIKHTNSLYKLEHSSGDNARLTRIYREKGWLTSDENVLDLLQDGYDSFELKVANRILDQHPEGVFLNNCKVCNKLARTPYAKQCRFCGHTWRDSSSYIVAKLPPKAAPKVISNFKSPIKVKIPKRYHYPSPGFSLYWQQGHGKRLAAPLHGQFPDEVEIRRMCRCCWKPTSWQTA